MSLLLGIDLGSSSLKAALLDADTGLCVASASYPTSEAPIKALQPGWAEQDPNLWWQYLKECVNALVRKCVSAGASTTNAITQSHNNAIMKDVEAIGISYQMHGLVCLDKDLQLLRDAIIWCDSRGVPYGQRAFDALGHNTCLEHLHNAPGNFTATKLAWVKENEPELFDQIKYIMLPGDYLALRLSGSPATTACGLSEMMLYDFSSGSLWTTLMDHLGFPHSIIPTLVPTFGLQATVSASAAAELGLKPNTPITYRAGDQPNNALSLGVMNPGEVATTAGTSGVVYGIKECVNASMRKCANPTNTLTNSQINTLINTFLHVNGNLGLMHCINGCGILNAWMKRTVAPELSYDNINDLASTVAVGSDGLSIIPFGNGAERVLENRNIGSSIHGIDLNRHNRNHLLRATQEGIAFALYYGMEMMGEMQTIKAGRANMFLSPLFREALSSVSGATIELYDTDGAAGAARGAGIGSGIFNSPEQAFSSLNRLSTTQPSTSLVPAYKEAYLRWKNILSSQLN